MDERPASTPLREVGGYRLLRKLGAGGMGTVYEALDAEERLVALKLLHPAFSADEAARERLRREVATLHRVRGEHVARVLDAEADSDEAFIVTELIDGQTLEDSIDEHGPMDAEELAGLAHGLAEALESVHAAGVVHRDLKPANVMLTDDGPVVIDFGISQLADDVRLTQTGMVTGTPGYVDPEVMRGADPGTSGDWWGWAAVLVFSATGRPPFGRGPGVLLRVEAGRADVAGLHPRVAQVLRRALHPDPERRMRTATVLRALTDHAEGREVTSVLAPGEPDGYGTGMDDDGASERPSGVAGVVGAAPASYVPGGSGAALASAPAAAGTSGPAPAPAAPGGARPSGPPPSYAPSGDPAAAGPVDPRAPQPGDRPATAVMPLALRQQYPPTQVAPIRDAAAPPAELLPPQPREVPRHQGEQPRHPAQPLAQPPAQPQVQPQGPPAGPTPSTPAWPPLGPTGPGGGEQPGQVAGPAPGLPGQWPDWAIPARARPGVTGAWWLATVALGTLWPFWTLLAFLAVFLLLGTVGSAARSLRGRRIRRGPGRWDLVTTSLASPWHLVLSALLTLPGLIVAVLGGGIVWGLASPSLSVDIVVPAAVAVMTLLLWWTPSSGHAREGARSVLAVFAPGARAAWVWVALALAVLATALVLLLVGGLALDWAPWGEPPIPRF